MPEHPEEISCQDVKRLLDQRADLLLFDCRELEEKRLVAISGSILLPMSEIEDRIDELAEYKDQHLVIHCHLGMRSAQVAAWLRQQGFANVQSMAGGIDRWATDIEPAMARY